MKRKTFHFVCYWCNQRKPQKHESEMKPGMCQKCYQKRCEIAERKEGEPSGPPNLD